MPDFSDEVKYILREAGWQEGRSIATRPYAIVQTAVGSAWFEAAESFLREFGGLQPRFLRHDGSVTNLQFEPLLATQAPHFAAAYEHLSQELRFTPLAVIGLAYGDDLLLLMDAAGRIYGAGCDDCRYLIGNDAAAALTALCLDQPFQLL